MWPTTISSIRSLYQHRQNDPAMADDRVVRQSLLRAAESSGSDEMEELLVINEPIEQAHVGTFSFSSTTNRLQPYIEVHANLDRKEHLSCMFSVAIFDSFYCDSLLALY